VIDKEFKTQGKMNWCVQAGSRTVRGGVATPSTLTHPEGGSANLPVTPLIGSVRRLEELQANFSVVSILSELTNWTNIEREPPSSQPGAL